MTITALLAPMPKWVLINDAGTKAGGAYLFTYSNQNNILKKPVYKDAGMSLAWTNPIIFDANGVQGPFYWTVNSADLEDTYYLEAYDGDPAAGGNLLWTLSNYFPPGSGGGGGGNTTSYIPISNYIANNQFIDHIDDTIAALPINLVIAPSNHKGFTPALVNPIIGTWGAVGPDIRFLKDSTANTDFISFPLFALGSAPLIGDVTPVDYVRYRCTTANPGEGYKCFQFPITQKIKNLSNQAMTFKFWGAVTATPATVELFVRQYFGSGTSPSAEVHFSAGTKTLTATWTQYTISVTIPDVAIKSIGNAGLQTDDDALYLQLQVPLNQPVDILFTKPKLYLGTLDPSLEFEDYDQINSINSTPRTGDIRVSLTTAAPNGWVAMNDLTIGNAGSGATNRANKDTFQLYSTIYTSVINTWAAVSGGRTAPGTTMANAATDFVAGKTLTLPKSLGRALAGFGTGLGLTARALGESLGGETHTLLAAELPPHTHTYLAHNSNNVAQAGGASGFTANTNQQTGDGGFANTPFTIMQPTSFMNVFIKL